MSRILHAAHPARWALLLATVLVGLLSPVVASAAGGSEIEGVWSFNKGAVDIIAIPGGKFEGIVTEQTQFSSCPHKVEEHVWTDITAQPDGSYWGLDQWFHGAPECAKNTTLGPTAWRVLHEANGSRYLRVCFSDPGSTQPTIAASGAPKEASEYDAHHVGYGCVSSNLIEPLPVVQGTSTSTGSSSAPVESLTLPSAKQCLRPGLFKIRLLEPKYDPFKKVTVLFKGHKLATSHKGNYVVATLNLKLLKKSAFTVKIHATTLLGHKLSTTRTYHICTKKHTKHHGKRHHKKG
jgi:hypothetical protein